MVMKEIGQVLENVPLFGVLGISHLCILLVMLLVVEISHNQMQCPMSWNV